MKIDRYKLLLAYCCLAMIGFALMFTKIIFDRQEERENYLKICSLDDVICDFEPQPIIKEIHYGKFYAYSSEVGQTDNSPFITANGQRVGNGLVANNCLPFGTEIWVYGGQLSNDSEVWEAKEVNDRMNSRYDCDTFDIWFENTQEAKAWGVKILPYYLNE